MQTKKSLLGTVAVASAAAAALLFSFSAEAELSSEPADGAAKVLGVRPGDLRSGSEAQLKQMHSIAKKMVCLCGDCPRYNLDECQCSWAHQNRKTIELAILDGKTEQQILDGYVEAYDLKVLDKLPDEGFGRVSYLFPYAVALLLLGLTVWMGFRSRRNAAPAPAPAAAEGDEARSILRRELEDLE